MFKLRPLCPSILMMTSVLVCAQTSTHGDAQSHMQQPKSAQIAQGFEIIFNQRVGNCVACHSIPNAQGQKNGIQSNFAPALDGVARRYDAAQLQQWLLDARVLRPHTLMPPFGADLGSGAILTPAQIEAVVMALKTLQ